MNWMTSAKNRVQRCKKKRSNDLRLAASSKLLGGVLNRGSQQHAPAPVSRPAQAKSAVVKPRQSTDIYMLNNLSRKRTISAASSSSAATESRESADATVDATYPEERRKKFDPLTMLQLSPFKEDAHTDEETSPPGQVVIFFNDGVQCDELGNAVAGESSNSNSKVRVVTTPFSRGGSLWTAKSNTVGARKGTTKVHKKYDSAFLQELFSDDDEHAPSPSPTHSKLIKGKGVPTKHASNHATGRSPDSCSDESLRLDVTPAWMSLDIAPTWGPKLVRLLVDSGAEDFLLRQVAQQLKLRAGGSSPISEDLDRALARCCERLTPHTALSSLYSVLPHAQSNVKGTIVVCDAIRFLESVDKHQQTGRSPINQNPDQAEACDDPPAKELKTAHIPSIDASMPAHKSRYTGLDLSALLADPVHQPFDDDELDLDRLFDRGGGDSYVEREARAEAREAVVPMVVPMTRTGLRLLDTVPDREGGSDDEDLALEDFL